MTVSASCWGNAGEQTFRYIPCGFEVHADRRFGDLVVPSSLTVGRWFDTPRYALWNTNEGGNHHNHVHIGARPNP